MNLDELIEGLEVLGFKVSAQIPAGGSDGQVLKRVSGAPAWAADLVGEGGGGGLPEGGTDGQVLKKVAGAAAWAADETSGGDPPTPTRSLVVVIGGTTYTTNTYTS